MSIRDASRFIVGSSLPATAISIIYIGSALNKNMETPDLNHIRQWFTPSLALIFGVSNMLSGRIFGGPRSQLQFALTGTVVGIVLSIIGRFGFDLPHKIFSFSRENEWKVHPVAAVLYSMIWAFPVYFVNNIIKSF